jgi:hypothetical protein
MASAAITLSPPSREHRSWSLETLARCAVPLAFAAPLAVMAIVVDRRGFVSVPHTVLEVNGALARHAGPEGLRWAYPPLPTFLASVLPDGALALALVSSLLAGVALTRLLQRLRERAVSLPLASVLLASLALVPCVLYGVTQDLAAFAGLAFLITAFDGFVRFSANGETQGGFQAGLMLALAFGCDPVALVYAAALAAAAPLMAHLRYRSEPDAATATASVLVFPVIAAAGAWAFLEWRFTGAVFGTVRAEGGWLAFPGGVGHSLVEALRHMGANALRAPVYLSVGVLLFARRRLAAAGYALPLVGLVVARWIGLPYSDVSAFMLLAAIGIVTVPARPTGVRVMFLATAAVVQLAVGWFAFPTSGDLERFLHVLS